MSNSTSLSDSEQEDAASADKEETLRGREVSNGSVEVSHDAFFDAMSNRRRRYALHYLKRRNDDEPVALSDISAQVTAWERDVEPKELSYADRKSVHTSLSQFHAPKLEELGFVRFDRDAGTVALTDRAVEVDVYLEAVSARDLPWGPYLLLLSSFLSAVVFASLVGAPMLGELSRESLLVFVAVTLLSSSAAFAYDTWTRMRVGADGPPPEVER